MNFFSFALRGRGTKGKTNRRRASLLSGCNYSQLEGRKLLATVGLDNGVLSIFGTNVDDQAMLASFTSGTIIRVTVSGLPRQDFARSEIQEVLFIGVGGDDVFANNTDIPSRAFGNNGNDTLTGGSGNDVLVGGGGTDVLQGNAGDDIIRGGGGGAAPNQLFGGDGNDRLFGGVGNNTINGEGGNDVVFGSAGDDTVNGGDGDDQLYVGAGNNTVRGGNGDDIVIGGAGIDTVFGEAGIDRVYALGGNDVIDGGNDLDILFGGDGDDRHIGGGGNDQIRTGRGDDFADGGTGNDFISGFQGNNTLNGGTGDDRINAGSGNDIVDGGDGTDRLFGQAGNDTIEGGAGDDFIVGDVGNDTIRGGNGLDQIFGSEGDDFLEGGNQNDLIFGLTGNDQLFGSAGNDTLIAGDGLDGLSGGTGSDVLFGGRGADRFLSLSGDDRRDFASSDALLEFRTGNVAWTHREIEVLDEGLRRLHVRTGGTRVLEDSLNDTPLIFFKQTGAGNSGEFGINELENSFTFTSDGQLQSEVFTRRIELADWNENDEIENERRVATIIHEIAHNWDSAREISEAFPGQGFLWNSFIAQSEWRTAAASGFTRATTQTTEPFDLVFNASNTTFTQVVNTWYYRNGSTFARDYGAESPKEDWSTVWEAALSDDNADRVGVGNKVFQVNRLFNLL